MPPPPREAGGGARPSAIAAVIFDLDGVLVDSEGAWNAARREVALHHGGQWPADAQRAMMGMSSTEWSAYMHDELGVAMSPAQISETVVASLEKLYRDHLPLLPGAREAVVGCARVWPLALASSANRPIIDLVLDLAGLKGSFAATVSSEEVAHGKPAPDVYLEAARQLGLTPAQCVAVEDSSNGIRSAVAAGMAVVAVPNREFPPATDALALAGAVVGSLAELTPDRVQRVADAERQAAWASGTGQ
jgi:HAD superfamily hydrolase (TIGR01509 family)